MNTGNADKISEPEILIQAIDFEIMVDWRFCQLQLKFLPIKT